MKAILTSDRHYGIVIDEVNNSQTGTTASKLQATLALQANDEMAKLTIGELITHRPSLFTSTHNAKPSKKALSLVFYKASL